MEHKKLKSGILLATISVLLLANLAVAPIASAAVTLKCNDLNPKTVDEATGKAGNDANPDYTNVKNSVVTINEEEIGSQTATMGGPEGMKILYCIRKTICNKKKDPKGCNSFFVATGGTECQPSPNIDDDPYTSCQRVQVLYAPTGAALLYGYIGLIYRYTAGIIGIVSVLFLVWGGVEIATAGDNPGRVDKAKERIFQSIAGLVLLFLSAVILYTINPNFFTLF